MRKELQFLALLFLMRSSVGQTAVQSSQLSCAP